MKNEETDIFRILDQNSRDTNWNTPDSTRLIPFPSPGYPISNDIMSSFQGTYQIHDFYLDNSKFTVPQIYGEYRTEGLIYKDDVLIACYYLFLDAVPKARE